LHGDPPARAAENAYQAVRDRRQGNSGNGVLVREDGVWIGGARVKRRAKPALDPLEVSQGTHPHTCVAATLMYKLAREKPAELERLASGLLADGRVRLAGGATLEAVPDSLPEDGTGRSQVQRVVQAAFHGFGESVGQPGVFLSQPHALLVEDEQIPAEGLSVRQAAALYQQVLGLPDLQTLAPGDLQAVRQATSRGEGVPATLRTVRGSGHEVLLEGVDEKWVHYRDPEGEHASPFPGEGSDVDEHGKGRISHDAFRALAAAVHVPLDCVPFELRPPGAWML
jgi:hypothetical protein